MGLDRFAKFISKIINIDGSEDLNINNSVRKIVTNNVIFDINFLIYQKIIDIENEINDIIKVILCLPFSLNNRHLLENYLKNVFNQDHWKHCGLTFNIETIFDGYNEDDIIKNFILYLTSNNTQNNLELVIYEKINTTIIKYIEKIHHNNYLQSIALFFDGIPSVSKIIEQRKRRMKNYLESIEKKKIFNKYFDNLNVNITKLIDTITNNHFDKNIDIKLINMITYDYFKWIQYRFSINKSICPASLFINNLELYLHNKLSSYYSKLKIYINSSKENGESDFKIFKYISTINLPGDYCIHTTDSDIIHEIIVQQTYYKIISKDINLSVIRYLNKNENIQYIDANILIKTMMEMYNNTNNIKNNNYKIIWDLCFIFLFFGNDHLPSSIEVGPELGFEFYFKCHYNSLGKTNFINNKKSYINIDLKQFNLFLKEIFKTKDKNITKIILQRFFKINNSLISILIDRLNLDFDKLLIFLKNFIIYQSLHLTDSDANKLNNNDLRKIYIKNFNMELKSSYMDLSIFNFSEYQNKIFIDSINIIEENINYYEHKYNGLILYVRPQYITMDLYQDLYTFITDNILNNNIKITSEYYDYIDIDEHLLLINKLNENINSNVFVHDYLKKLYHIANIQFGDMSNFHSDNITYYKHTTMPSLLNIINYIDSLDFSINQPKIWLNEFNSENIILKEEYLNSTTHQLLISPFINKILLSDEIINIIKDNNIENIFLDNEKIFKYREVDIKQYLSCLNKIKNIFKTIAIIDSHNDIIIKL
jgi:hypothetical protein